MADFIREFDVKNQIKLEQNYRSYSNILDCANALISHNSNRLGKNLRTSQGPGEPVRIYEAPSDLAEAAWMVDEIKQLVRNDGFTRQEIAVLYRSNAQSRVIESALFNSKIPYRVYGGLRFFERAEIKHALAYLRLLENPHDDTSFLRVVNFPHAASARARSKSCRTRRAAAALAERRRHRRGRRGRHQAAGLCGTDRCAARANAGRTLREIIETVEEQSGLIEHYRNEKEGADRIENLQELVTAAESFVTQEGFGRDAVAMPLDEQQNAPQLSQSPVSQGLDPNQPLLDEALRAPAGTAASMVNADTGETLSPLQAFLVHAALEAGDNQAQAGQDAVQLMTVHASKGLEFDAVFIGGVEEGLFPHENAMMDRGGLEEERRLAYVAITRARKRLYLSHSQTRMLHGQTRYNVKSRFFDELPEEALKWITPRQSGFGSFAPSQGLAVPGDPGAQASSAPARAGAASRPKSLPARPCRSKGRARARHQGRYRGVPQQVRRGQGAGGGRHG
jgi:DNA helicase-2/ATP-dependent DNA helicase PcrA